MAKLGLKSTMLQDFEVVTPNIDYDCDLSNKSTWKCCVDDGDGNEVFSGNYLACLFYKYKHGGHVNIFTLGKKVDDTDVLADKNKNKLKGGASEHDYIIDVDYETFYNKEQKTLGENMNKTTKQKSKKIVKESFGNKFIFINKQAKTLKESVLCEHDDILAAMDQMHDKQIDSPEHAIGELNKMEHLIDDDTVLLVVDSPTEASVFDALDAWTDEQLALNQISDEDFMVNNGVMSDIQPDYEDITKEPNNARAKMPAAFLEHLLAKRKSI